MSAGMADIIAAHGYSHAEFSELPIHGWADLAVCICGVKLHMEGIVEPDERDGLHAAHVAEELAKAGYGNVPAALLAAADEMPIETLQGADKASVWLRHRAHSQDPEGHALVKAIHDRKAEA